MRSELFTWLYNAIYISRPDSVTLKYLNKTLKKSLLSLLWWAMLWVHSVHFPKSEKAQWHICIDIWEMWCTARCSLKLESFMTPRVVVWSIYKMLQVDEPLVYSQRSNWVRTGAQWGKSKYRAPSANLIELMQGIFLLNTARKSGASKPIKEMKQRTGINHAGSLWSAWNHKSFSTNNEAK